MLEECAVVRMRFLDIIEKKKNKLTLSDEEIQFWIDGVTDGTIPDYQTSALLMAIVLNGMDDRETAKLAEAMMNSGHVMDLSSIGGIKADKHSTGGVGDKTSLALGAMVAAWRFHGHPYHLRLWPSRGHWSGSLV